MPQKPSPWRANDAVLHGALRDELRASIAALLSPSDTLGNDAVRGVQELRTAFYSVDGFDRIAVVESLNDVRSQATRMRSGYSHD